MKCNKRARIPNIKMSKRLILIEMKSVYAISAIDRNKETKAKQQQENTNGIDLVQIVAHPICSMA